MAVRIQSLSELGFQGEVIIPDQLQALHESLQQNPIIVEMTSYGVGGQHVAEGPDWFVFEKQILQFGFTLLSQISSEGTDDPVCQELSSGSVSCVPFKHVIGYRSGQDITAFGGYFDSITRKCFLHRRNLAYQLVGTLGTLVHEVTHALDPDLDPATYLAAGMTTGFPEDIVRSAEIKAFSAELKFFDDAKTYFDCNSNESSPEFLQWLSLLIAQRKQHCEMRLNHFRQ